MGSAIRIEPPFFNVFKPNSNSLRIISCRINLSLRGGGAISRAEILSACFGMSCDVDSSSLAGELATVTIRQAVEESVEGRVGGMGGYDGPFTHGDRLRGRGGEDVVGEAWVDEDGVDVSREGGVVGFAEEVDG